MADGDEFAGVTPAEWLLWLQRIDRKLDKFLEAGRLELQAFEMRDALGSRIANLEGRVANIERKLDISTAFEPN